MLDALDHQQASAGHGAPIDWATLLRGDEGLIELFRLLHPVAVPQIRLDGRPAAPAARVAQAARVWGQIKERRPS
eukprot:1635225-Prymnesium_polylepis.1